MESTHVTDGAAAVRRARFGNLPARIRQEDMVEEKAATPSDPARHDYNPEGSWRSFSCLAVDLGL
ncbi:hypothetical protein ACFWXK_23630 [Streptomyces sp. NPDC059070]|uniref:hypothetical protein n=1 Tax=unclassified Streptomyces TaxID=2593676 RepID=UPI0034E2A4A0